MTGPISPDHDSGPDSGPGIGSGPDAGPDSGPGPGPGPGPGTRLPAVSIPVTPTFIVSTALATRDFQDVHHDRDRAVAGGAKDIFLNILSTTGLVQRYVTDWAGPNAVVRAVAVRLGVPCCAYETLTLTGEVTAHDGEHVTVSVVGRVSSGDHVAGTVTLRVSELTGVTGP